MFTGNHRNGGATFSNGGNSSSNYSKGSGLYSSSNNGNTNGAKVMTNSSDKQISSSLNSSSKSISSSLKPKPRRSSTASLNNVKSDSGVGGRVRVAVRLRPRNAEESVADSDLPDCVELQPELKRLKLRRNNWDSDTFEFDEVLTEFASQKRVYEVVAKPVVESVLEGYNGTVMAYGQTGTGKTYTLGLLGDEDTSARGIMVRALEDILAEISPDTDSVSVSYLQLYMETIQDLLRPENDNISIVEDPKTGDLSLPGATTVEIKDQKTFIELLRVGEAHRFAANTKLNTESSRSHAILMVHIKRSLKGKDSALSNENGNLSHSSKKLKPIVRRGKFVVVDLAGSERIDKSGSEGHTLEEAKSINLSLSALGKCINALAENSPHVPIRDSKLTRLLRDSFGGSARTSLVITIGPSPRHRGETASTIMFGQRAMKVENMLRIKEEFDYKSLSRRLDIQLDKLIAENERKQKAFQDEIERIAIEAQKHVADIERNYADALEKERLSIERECMDSTEKLQQQLLNVQGKHADGKVGFLLKDDGSDKMPNSEYARLLAELDETKQLLQNETLQRKTAEEEIFNLRNQLAQWKKLEAVKSSEIIKLHKMLEDESQEKEKLEKEIAVLQNQLLEISFEADETRRLDVDESGKLSGDLTSLISQANHPSIKDFEDGEKPSMAKLFEQVGLQKILSLLDAEDADVKIHAAKVVANLAAEESNQEKIVEAGGLTSLLMLIRSCDDETIQRVAAGAIANLAMNETNQELIVSQGGINLLSTAAANANDPQTLRMVAGAIANLCGNDKLRVKLSSEGGIKALLGMVRSRHPDVLAQVARGIANFAKCESRVFTQGNKMGKSLLIEDGGLPWIVQNANNDISSIRRHIELALCHLAQHEANAKDLITAGALWELVRIAQECSRDDVRSLAYKTLTSSSSFLAEVKRQRIDCR
ncbi:OLC1v1029438C4 [Oldenlandia corymbosa var. corymbosa]|uniref:Kinesin-like protein n=2 Tax=Oldenlandia corymbosa var. corymbosa TaxID=529605 RepID=A0AAV1CEJ4_OLDCO|nr:OLC1v1029438C4 [Oldenlandia corymbosa var. corymbosa]